MAAVGERAITAVPDHVDEQRVGYGALDFGHVEDMCGSGLRPPVHPLRGGDAVHQQRQKLLRAAALGECSANERLHPQATDLPQISIQETGHEALLRPRTPQFPESGKEVVEERFLAVHGKPSGRHEHRVHQRGAGTRTADDENRSLHICVPPVSREPEGSRPACPCLQSSDPDIHALHHTCANSAGQAWTVRRCSGHEPGARATLVGSSDCQQARGLHRARAGG